MNTFIKRYHDDFVQLDVNLLYMGLWIEAKMYRINGREVWTKWEELK